MNDSDDALTRNGVPQDLLPLESRTVRRIVVDNEWLYCLDDVLDYFKEDVAFYKRWWRSFSQKRDENGYKTMIREVEMDGARLRVTNATGIFRLVQGLKGGRAEKVKTWLAHIAVERATEEINPSLAVERAVRVWFRRGRSDEWINERLRNLRVRRGFTDEMQCHGASTLDYAILTNIVHQGTFGISVRAHYALKEIVPAKTELREEMTTTELILLSLGEHTSTVLAQASPQKSIGVAKEACRKGGSIAGNARREIEAALGRPVVTSERASDQAQPSLPNKAP
jgi:hypothetical protein